MAEVAKGRHGCPVCPERFKTVGEKRRHIKQKHPR